MAETTPGEVTRLLLEWNRGSETARAALIGVVYRELRQRASRLLDHESPGHTFQPTALIHETYLKLVDQRRVQWQNRSHFFAVAAGVMRRILVDHARRRGAKRRGGPGAQRLPLSDEACGFSAERDVEVLALDASLETLAALDPDQARIVELRFFAGLTVEETAEAVGVSRATVEREWAMARAWLRCRLDDSADRK